VLGLGLASAGLNVTEAFYWDLNERTRRFAKRLAARVPNTRPDQAQASSYAITRHWLQAVAVLGPDAATHSGRAVVARMKAMPTDDDAFGPGRIRTDGRGEFPTYLFAVKPPTKPGGWDLYRLVGTTPAAQAVHPLNPKCTFAPT
jgi:branched-chain amino acid transport system substrate-binding protein